MGAAVSTNVIKMISKTMATESTSVIQETRLSEDSSQIIYVDNIDGDVTITGNVFYQTAHVNMKALMTALTTQDAQQKMITDLSQQAKSLVSGLNIGQVAVASNTTDLLIEATISLLTTISQTCVAVAGSRQELTIKRVKGNVTIQNNVFEQMNDLVASCVQSAVANSSEIQDITAKLDQSASATADGLSLWAIVALIAALILVPVGGAVYAGKAAMKYIFPIVGAVGAILIVVWYLWTKDTMRMFAFSLITDTDVCLPVQLSTSGDYENVAQANDACFKNPDCAAFQFQTMSVNADGTYQPRKPPDTTFFSSVSDDCANGMRKDNVRTIRNPSFFFGPKDPDSTYPKPADTMEGDAYLNTTTSQWSQFYGSQGGWTVQGVLVKKEPFAGITIGNTAPTEKAADNQYYLLYDPKAPNYMSTYVYTNVAGGWSLVEKVRGPGQVPHCPDKVNTNGFRDVNRKAALLYIGIASIIIGIIGTIVQLLIARSNAAADAKLKSQYGTSK